MYGEIDFLEALKNFFAVENLTITTKYVVFFSIIVNVILYFLKGVGLFKISKNLGLKKEWLSFVPILSTFSFGKIAEQYVKMNGKKSAKFGKILLILNILQIIVSIAMYLIMIYSVAFSLEYVETGVRDENIFKTQAILLIAADVVIFLSLFALTLAYRIVYHIAFWRVCAIYSNKKATVFTILSIPLRFLVEIFVFAIRNKVSVSSAIYVDEYNNAFVEGNIDI